MNWKRICDGRRARSSRVLKMGVKESKSTSSSSCNQPARPVPTRTTKPVPERIHVWPKNSSRWHKLYDVYICSSDKDILYAKSLLLYLQEQPESLRCFLPMRDMNPGGAIPTEMTDGAENSHCWIMLLTSAFLSDQWCQYQMHQFLTMAPHGNGRLIPVLVKLTFEHYPKELRHMYSYRDAQGDQKVFMQLRNAIVSYLKDLKEETNNEASESGLSSSLHGDSQVTNSQKVESISDSSLKSSVTQGSPADTSLRSSGTQESTNTIPARCNINQVTPGGTSVKSSPIQEPSNNTSEITNNASRRRSITQVSTSRASVKSSVDQESIQEPLLKSSDTQESACITSGRGSLNQESTYTQSGKISIMQGIASDMPLTSPVTQVPTCDTFMRSHVTQESTYLGPWSPKPTMDYSSRNYEMVVFNTNTLTINCDTVESSTSTRTSAEQIQPITRKVGSGSCKKEATINMDYQSFESDISSNSARFPTRNNSSSSLQSNIYSSCGGAQVNKDAEILQGDKYITNTSSDGTNAEMKDSLDLQRDLYTSYRTKAENKEFQSNIYTSCGGVKAENKNSGSDLSISCGSSQAPTKDTLSLKSNICTRYSRSEDSKSLIKDRYPSWDQTEEKKEDSKILPEGLSVSCDGMQKEKVDSPNCQSDLYTSYDGKHAYADFQSLQTDMYTSFKGDQREQNTSRSFQTDLYTSYRERQAELKNTQDLHGELNPSFCGLRAPNMLSEGLQNDIYNSPNGDQMVKNDFQAPYSDLYLSGTTTQTVVQNLSAIQSKLCQGCDDTQAEDCSSCDIYASCTSAKARSSDRIKHRNIDKDCISAEAVKTSIHIYGDDSSRPASEAADKT